MPPNSKHELRGENSAGVVAIWAMGMIHPLLRQLYIWSELVQKHMQEHVLQVTTTVRTIKLQPN